MTPIETEIYEDDIRAPLRRRYREVRFQADQCFMVAHFMSWNLIKGDGPYWIHDLDWCWSIVEWYHRGRDRDHWSPVGSMIQIIVDRGLQEFWVVEKTFIPDVPGLLYVKIICWKAYINNLDWARTFTKLSQWLNPLVTWRISAKELMLKGRG